MVVASFPTWEEGEGCGEAEVLLSLGAAGCLFRDHPADYWSSAS